MKTDNKPDNALLMSLAGSSGLHEKAKDCMARGDYAGAEMLLERALSAKESAEAYHDLGVVYRALGKPEAEQAFLAALECNPQYDPSLAMLGQIYLTAGDPMRALECYARATSAKPDNLAYAEKFLELARFITVNNHNPQLKELLGTCLKRGELDFTGMGGAWHSVLVNNPAFAKIYKTAGKDDKVFDKLGAYEALTDSYFIDGLKRVVVFDRGFERFLTFLRRRLLENLNAGSKRFLGRDYKDVAAALAQYCFTTEYIFDITGDEQKRIDELRGNAEKLDADSVAILSCYIPPYDIPSAHAKSLFPELITSWTEQLEIRKSIPSLTKIEDDVSTKVRDQYEQFPYPRWQGFARLIKDEEAEGRLRGTKASILVAGCGTGKEPIELATVFPDAQILAFDLSRASIAYGAQKAKALDLKNITFKQGDILGLDKFDQRFDYVTASGVLHHMNDPARGWKILVNLLRSGGLMRIALYSRTARRPITAARKVIAAKGYKSDSEGIRSFRRDIDSVMGKADREFITGMRDYYYMSDCRDLLFHVQEHQMDILQIAGLMKDFGLELVKLYLPDNVIQQYRREFPADPSLKNLNSWAKFEEKRPETFREMYKFWCRKI